MDDLTAYQTYDELIESLPLKTLLDATALEKIVIAWQEARIEQIVAAWNSGESEECIRMLGQALLIAEMNTGALEDLTRVVYDLQERIENLGG